MKSKITIAILCGVAALLWLIVRGQTGRPDLTYSQFLERVQNGQVASVVIIDGNSGANRVICRLSDGATARTVLPADYQPALMAMQDKRVNIEIRDSSSEPLVILMKASPFLALLAVWIFLLKNFKNGPRPRIFG